MNTEFTLTDHSDDLIEPHLTTVAVLQSAPGLESTGMYCENNGLKDPLILGIKWGVYKNVYPRSSWLPRHARLRRLIRQRAPRQLFSLPPLWLHLLRQRSETYRQVF
jgi:hypothetical protein